MDGSNSWVLWTSLVILLLISGFFSGSETGMMSLNRYRLRHQRKKSAGARRAAKLLATPDKLIGLILIGNNAVNILAAIIANMLAVIYVGPSAAPWVATASLTILVLVFSEITPKSIAAQNPEWFAFKASHVLRPMMYFLSPLVWIINRLTNELIGFLGFDPNKNRDDGLDTEELKSVVDVSGHKISDNHQRMLKGILDLENVTIEDIMIPRNEIVGLDLENPIDHLKLQIVNSQYSRLPVYDGDINNVIGIFHLRKRYQLLRSNMLSHDKIKRFCEDTYFVPESTSLITQLLNFQKSSRRYAMVVDEYGEVQGLVTLEDILEEIVGDFNSNDEDQDHEIIMLTGGSYSIDGTVTIREINKTTGWNLPTNGPKTLNGLVLEELERIPNGNVSFLFDGYKFETKAFSSVMIKKVVVTSVASNEEEDLET